MKIFILSLSLLITSLFTSLCSAATADQHTLLSCQKKDFFYWGESLYVKLFSSNNQLIIQYTYQSGTASIAVQKISDREYAGSTKHVSAELKLIDGNTYSFSSKDSYDGLLSIGPANLVCE